MSRLRPRAPRRQARRLESLAGAGLFAGMIGGLAMSRRCKVRPEPEPAAPPSREDHPLHETMAEILWRFMDAFAEQTRQLRAWHEAGQPADLATLLFGANDAVAYSVFEIESFFAASREDLLAEYSLAKALARHGVPAALERVTGIARALGDVRTMVAQRGLRPEYEWEAGLGDEDWSAE